MLTGTRERFVPALAGLLAAAMALVPFVVLGVATGLEIVMPLAAIVLDVAPTALANLVVLPGLVLIGTGKPGDGKMRRPDGDASGGTTASGSVPVGVSRSGPAGTGATRSGSSLLDTTEERTSDAQRWTVGRGGGAGSERRSHRLRGVGRTTTSASAEQPAQVETISGKDVKQVRLTDQAVKRLGIETTTVAAASQDAAGAAPAAPMMTVPYSAVIYSADGVAWVYTVPSPRTFIREKVVVANVGGDRIGRLALRRACRRDGGGDRRSARALRGRARRREVVHGTAGSRRRSTRHDALDHFDQPEAEVRRGPRGALLMFFGTMQVRDMPIDAFPEFAPPRVEIQTLCIGLSARDVEELVSAPMEQGLNGIEGLTAMRSGPFLSCRRSS